MSTIKPGRRGTSPPRSTHYQGLAITIALAILLMALLAPKLLLVLMGLPLALAIAFTVGGGMALMSGISSVIMGQFGRYFRSH